MELTTTRRQQQPLCDEPWAVAIRQRYGSQEAMWQKWSPAVQGYCAANPEQAVHTPLLVRMARSYGDEAMVTLVAMHMASVVLALTDDDTEQSFEDAKKSAYAAASLLVDDSRLGALPRGMLLTFVHRAKARQYRIFGKHATPMRLLDALQTAYRELMREAEEQRMRRKAREKAEADRKAEAEAMDWEQYRKLRGIDDPTPQAAIRRLCEEARRKNAASGTQNEAQTPPKTHGNAPPRQFDSKNE